MNFRLQIDLADLIVWTTVAALVWTVITTLLLSVIKAANDVTLARAARRAATARAQRVAQTVREASQRPPQPAPRTLVVMPHNLENN